MYLGISSIIYEKKSKGPLSWGWGGGLKTINTTKKKNYFLYLLYDTEAARMRTDFEQKFCIT